MWNRFVFQDFIMDSSFFESSYLELSVLLWYCFVVPIFPLTVCLHSQIALLVSSLNCSYRSPLCVVFPNCSLYFSIDLPFFFVFNLESLRSLFWLLFFASLLSQSSKHTLHCFFFVSACPFIVYLLSQTGLIVSVHLVYFRTIVMVRFFLFN